MPLSWNEIKTRAASFVLEWKDRQTVKEQAEAQTFGAEFLKIFGVDRKRVALFEHEVRFPDGRTGYIDLFWKGNIIIEMKTPGKDLDKAFKQAKEYALALKDKEIPKGILTCDFQNFQYYDLTDVTPEGTPKSYSFKLEELPAHVELFGYLAGYKEIDPFKQWDPVNVEAAEKMGKLYKNLDEAGYKDHELKLFLVRIMFCLFADDTGIFKYHHSFLKYIIERTNPDGSDLALHLHKIFEVLNTHEKDRLSTLDEQLKEFPHVNGRLFEERIRTADFTSAMRETIIECSKLDWSKISPAIFGAMFQSVMDADARHDIGAHYTSEENILKVIKPLFLDKLREEFNKIKKLSPASRREKLIKFHDKLASLKFLDPACGCGNFLVISYRELRLLEYDVLDLLLGKERLLDIHNAIKLNVDQFYGIEIEEFPAQIAQVALWLVDHQMNSLVQVRFGDYFQRIPLNVAPSIHYTNALTVDWESIIPKTELSYILGNPPFLGASIMDKRQKQETENIFNKMKNWGTLDYVTCWYKTAAQYIQGTNIKAAFVSTNSICQGEQVPVLWPELINKHGVKINFAHQTFKWSNEAKGKAAVYCVIIGFSLFDREDKKLYQYASVTGSPVETAVKRINAYLVDAPLLFIQKRNKPLSPVPEMIKGNYYAKSEGLIIEEDDYEDFIKRDPASKKYIKRLIGSNEFINNKIRYCLWLVDCPPGELKKMPLVMERLKKVREDRLTSTDAGMKKLAETPAVFRETNNPDKCLVIPVVSSETRKFIPMGFINKDIISTNSNLIMPEAEIYHFGVMTSTMHMAWMRYICGRLKSDYRYSASIVYNNFPWPSPTVKQKTNIEQAAQTVLDVRKKFANSSLAALYDPLTMPPELLKAHLKLDKAVEAAYGRPFADDSARVAFLFELYQKLTGELFAAENKKKSKKNEKQ